AWDEAGAGEDNGFEQIMARANRADAGQIGPDVSALPADGVATVAGHLLAEKDAAAAAHVAARGQQPLEVLQALDAILRRLMQCMKQRRGALTNRLRERIDERLQSVLAKRAQHGGRFLEHAYQRRARLRIVRRAEAVEHGRKRERVGLWQILVRQGQELL